MTWTALAFGFAILAFQPKILPDDAGPPVRGHGRISVESAITDVFCGFRTFRLSDTERKVFIQHPDGFRYQGSYTTYYLWENRAAMHVPLRQTVLDRWSSYDAYCEKFQKPAQSPDVGLLALNSLALHAYRDLTFYQLGLFHYGLKLLMLFGAVYFLMHAGAPVFLGFALIGEAFAITDFLYRDYYFSHYAYIPFLIIALATALAIFFRARERLSAPGFVLAGVSLGLLLCVAANVRTTLLFIGAGMIASAFTFAYGRLPDLWPRLERWNKAGVLMLLVGSVAVGYGTMEIIAFDRFKISKEDAVDLRRWAVSYHPMSHAVIAGLGFPPSDPPEVAVVEGFEFGDHTARLLAQRLDPTIGNDFNDRYERLLWGYVGHLWVKRPWLMVKAYAHKLVYSLGYSYKLCRNAATRYARLYWVACTVPIGSIVGLVLIPFLFWRRAISRRSNWFDRLFFDPADDGSTLYFMFFLTVGAAFMLGEMTLTFYVFTAHLYMAFYSFLIGVLIILGLVRVGIGDGLEPAPLHQFLNRLIDRARTKKGLE